MDVRLAERSVAFPSEAYARSAIEQGDWDQVLVHAQVWLEDQPFETTAANMASYVCSVGLEDWSRAIGYARLGLRAQPRDPGLLNNLAYALIEAGRVEEAEQQLGLIDFSSIPQDERVASLATRGLLKFRLGDGVGGREGYETAIRLAQQFHDPRSEAMARTMLLREQLVGLATDEAEALLKRVIDTASKLGDPGLSGCVLRVERMLKDRWSSPANHPPYR
jgi:tetratricopeptide (TPR) repeat protein